MARKAISAQGIMALMVICLLAIVGLIAYVVVSPAGGDVGGIGGGTAPPPSIGNCPDTLATDFEADCINKLNASGTDYLACVLSAVPDNDFSQFKAYTCAASSTRTTAVDLKCGHNYVIYGRATIDAINSFEPVSIGVVDGLIDPHVFQGTEFSALKANAYDNLNKAFVYDSTSADRGDLDDLGITFKSTTNNATATAMGVGSILDWSYTIQTTGSVGQFGDKDVGIYVAVDADVSDYEIPTLYFDGQLLTDIKGSGELSSDDEGVLAAYEYIYKIPDNIKTQPRTVRMVTQAKSGVDPDVDTVLRFCAKGYYVTADGYSLRKDCFNEATSSEIATATSQTITNDIS